MKEGVLGKGGDTWRCCEAWSWYSPDLIFHGADIFSGSVGYEDLSLMLDVHRWQRETFQRQQHDHENTTHPPISGRLLWLDEGTSSTDKWM